MHGFYVFRLLTTCRILPTQETCIPVEYYINTGNMDYHVCDLLKQFGMAKHFFLVTLYRLYTFTCIAYDDIS
jgi:hypothetical protein